MVPHDGIEDEDVRDRSVRSCAGCSGTLTVGERMFYFLEGVDAPPICRACLSRAGNTADGLPEVRPGARPTVVPEFSRAPAPLDAAARGPPELSLAVRRYLDEELSRSERLLDRVSPGSPDTDRARELHRAAVTESARDRLPEAVLLAADLRRTLTRLENPPPRSTDRAFWSGEVDEMLREVLERARAIDARAKADAPEPDPPSGEVVAAANENSDSIGSA